MNRVESALSAAADAFQLSVDKDAALQQDMAQLIAAGQQPNMFRILRWPDGSDPITLTMRLEPTPK